MFKGTLNEMLDKEMLIHPRTGLHAIGLRKNGAPIWPVLGGAIDVEPDENESADEEEEEWTPPTREDYEKLLNSKRAANKEAMDRRRFLEAHGIDWKTGERHGADEGEREGDEPKTPTTSPKTESAKRAAERAAAKVELKYKPAVAKLAVKNALADAGWAGKDLGLVMKLIDLDDVSVDDDGEITGVSDQIEALKAEFPSWFKKKRDPNAETGGAREVDGGKGKTAVPTGDKNGWAETMAARLMRGR